jgi:hypothetical protein
VGDRRKRGPWYAGEVSRAGVLTTVRISVSLADSASFFDGVLFVLLLIAVTALVWTMLSAKVREPLNIFTCVLAIATIGLTIVSFLQWRTLEKTDETWRAGERAFVFVTHNIAGWQQAKVVNGIINRTYPTVWENSGNSPTRDLVVELYCPEVQQSVVPKANGLGRSVWLQCCRVDPRSRQWDHLYIAAVADYFDIFDAHHRTETCFEIFNLSGNLADLTVVPQYDFSNCGRNCADKECDKP